MFSYFSGYIEEFGEDNLILKNDMFGVKIIYFGFKRKGDFFLFPVLDTNNSTFYYLAFDDIKQLDLFHKLQKISGIGYKIANYISTSFDLEDITNALKENDVNFFKQVPGIGIKTAKKILLELKDKIDISDLENLEKIEKYKLKVISSLSSLGYKKSDIENALKTFKGDISNTKEVISYVISKIK